MESQAWLAGWEGLWSPRSCFMEFYGTRLLETKTLALSTRMLGETSRIEADKWDSSPFLPLLDLARIMMRRCCSATFAEPSQSSIPSSTSAPTKGVAQAPRKNIVVHTPPLEASPGMDQLRGMMVIDVPSSVACPDRY